MEAAGAGFAAAVALAGRYAGQEISSSQALVDAGIALASGRDTAESSPSPVTDRRAASEACERVLRTLAEQSAGWRQRSFFERQWMQRDFRQRVGVPVERCLETLGRVQRGLASGDVARARAERALLDRLAGFYGHLGNLARSYGTDPEQREEQARIVGGWNAEVERLVELIGTVDAGRAPSPIPASPRPASRTR